MLAHMKNKKPYLASPLAAYHVSWWIPVDGPLDLAKAEKTRGSFTLRNVDREEVATKAEERIRREIDGVYDGADIVGFAYLVLPLLEQDLAATGRPVQ